MTFIDTDTLTLVSYGRPGLTERVLAARDAGELAVPIIARLEILRGRIEAVRKAATAGDVLRMQERLAEAESFLAAFRVVPFDPAAGRHFDHLRALKGLRGTERGDLLIACIALANDATLVTRNTKDYAKVRGLKLADWTA